MVVHVCFFKTKRLLYISSKVLQALEVLSKE